MIHIILWIADFLSIANINIDIVSWLKTYHREDRTNQYVSGKIALWWSSKYQIQRVCWIWESKPYYKDCVGPAGQIPIIKTLLDLGVESLLQRLCWTWGSNLYYKDCVGPGGQTPIKKTLLDLGVKPLLKRLCLTQGMNPY